MDYKERIAEEAEKMFVKYGIRAVTMDSIAQELGISKRTIYENFEDKDTLLTHVIHNKARQQKDAFYMIMASCDNVIEVVFKIIETALNQIGNTNPTYMMDLKKYHHKVYTRLYSRGDLRNSEMSLAILSRGVEEELFRGDINIEIVNEGVQGVIDSAHANETFRNPNYKRLEVLDNLLFNFLRGISTDKGQKLIIEHRNNILN